MKAAARISALALASLALASTAADARIRYGAADALQFGDLRLPSGRGPFPVAIVIHGGCTVSTFADVVAAADRRSGDRAEVLPVPGAGQHEPNAPTSAAWPVVCDQALALLGMPDAATAVRQAVQDHYAAFSRGATQCGIAPA